VGAIAAPNEAKAAGDVNRIYGCFSPGLLNWNHGGCGYIEGHKLPFFDNLYYGNLYINGICVGQGIWEKKVKADPDPEPAEPEAPPFNFGLLAGEYLQVMTSIDVQCDVYELQLESRLIVENVTVIGNNSYQTIPVSPSNVPYLILFKVNGNVVSQQHFIFNSPNDLFIGGNNE